MGSEVRRTDGQVLLKRPLGSKLMGKGTVGDGLEESPLVRRWAGVLDGPNLIEDLDRDGLDMLPSQALSKCIQERTGLLDCIITRARTSQRWSPLPSGNQRRSENSKRELVSQRLTGLLRRKQRGMGRYLSLGEMGIWGLLFLTLFILIGLRRGSFTIVLGL